MAEVSTSRRSIAGIILAVAGALLLIDFILGLAGVTALGGWLGTIAALAIGVAFLILAIGSFRATLVRIALVVGAIGWLLISLSAVVALPSPVGEIAAAAAALGTLVAAIMLLVGKEVTNLTAIVFLVTAIIGALILAGAFGLDLVSIAVVLEVLFALGLLVTGILFARVQGASGR